MKIPTVKVGKNFKLVLAALFVALLIAGQTLNAGAFAVRKTAAPLPRTELESSTEAKRGLAGIDSRKFAKVKDARERRALQRSYDALKAVANNTSKAREAGLMAGFARTITVLKGLPPPPNASVEMCQINYETCMKMCQNKGMCSLCSMGNEMCTLGAWSAAREQEALP